MLYLIIGIVIGAAFHEFWHELFQKVKALASEWFSDKGSAGEDGSTAQTKSTVATEQANAQSDDGSQKTATS